VRANHTEHKYSPYVTGNTQRLRYRAQPVNAVHCEKTQIQSVGKIWNFIKRVVHMLTAVLNISGCEAK
jgi:hypothetical protein